MKSGLNNITESAKADSVILFTGSASQGAP